MSQGAFDDRVLFPTIRTAWRRAGYLQINIPLLPAFAPFSCR